VNSAAPHMMYCMYAECRRALAQYKLFIFLPQAAAAEHTIGSMAPIAVIGATGGVGQEAVKHLLAQDREVRAVGRSKERLEATFGTSHKLQIVQASVEDADSLKAALDGVSGVINASSG